MIPDSIWWALPKHPGPHRVLLLLWQYAGKESPAFAWPSVETLAARLRIQPRPIREALAKLEELDLVRPALEVRFANGKRSERVGWRLFETTEECEAYDRARALDPQLDLFAGAPCGQPVEDEPVDAEPAGQVSTNAGQVALNIGPGGPEIGPGGPHTKEGSFMDRSVDLVVNVGAPEHDDDAARIWTRYERHRVQLLGGIVRDGPPPATLRALIASHGAVVVEAYAVRSLELAAAARARGRHCAAELVAARSDGREWHPARLQAVASWEEPANEDSPPRRAAAPPDPRVDGARVDLLEREAYERGGEEAVRAQRRELAERPRAGVSLVEGWLASKRGATCET